MDEKVPLPDGGWALLRDPKRVTERKRRPVIRAHGRLMASGLGAVLVEKERRERAATVDGLVPAAARRAIDDWSAEEMRKLMGSDDMETAQDLDDRLIDAFVAQWSYDSEPSADAALDLPGEVIDALKKACAPRLRDLIVDFQPADPTDDTTPTVPSAD